MCNADAHGPLGREEGGPNGHRERILFNFLPCLKIQILFHQSEDLSKLTRGNIAI